MRTPFALLAALSVVALLAGCSAGETPQTPTSDTPASTDTDTCDAPEPGPISDGITVTGTFGKDVSVEFDTPMIEQTNERTIVSRGDGEEAVKNRTVKLAVEVYNGTSGDRVMSAGFGEDSPPLTYTVGDRQIIPGLEMLTECVPVGSRVVVAAYAKDAIATDPTDFGFASDDMVIFVGDVLEMLPWRASGTPQPAPEGFPKVELADDGTPTITIPDTDPPTETKIAELKRGDGEVVESGDTVTVHYQGVNWRTGEVFDQSWGKAPAQFATDRVVKGFSEALVGHKVGSQVIAIVAPEDGYGPNGGQPTAGIEADDTLVFVVDILGTTHAQ